MTPIDKMAIANAAIDAARTADAAVSEARERRLRAVYAGNEPSDREVNVAKDAARRAWDTAARALLDATIGGGRC